MEDTMAVLLNVAIETMATPSPAVAAGAPSPAAADELAEFMEAALGPAPSRLSFQPRPGWLGPGAVASPTAGHSLGLSPGAQRREVPQATFANKALQLRLWRLRPRPESHECPIPAAAPEEEDAKDD